MPTKKYIGDSKMFEYDKYYRECKQLNKPFVKARTSVEGKDYFVQVDLMTCNYELSKQSQQEINQYVQNEIDFVMLSTDNDFRGYHIDKEIAWFDGVSFEHVDEFCKTLYDLVQKNLN